MRLRLNEQTYCSEKNRGLSWWILSIICIWPHCFISIKGKVVSGYSCEKTSSLTLTRLSTNARISLEIISAVALAIPLLHPLSLLRSRWVSQFHCVQLWERPFYWYSHWLTYSCFRFGVEWSYVKHTLSLLFHSIFFAYRKCVSNWWKLCYCKKDEKHRSCTCKSWRKVFKQWTKAVNAAVFPEKSFCFPKSAFCKMFFEMLCLWNAVLFSALLN